MRTLTLLLTVVALYGCAAVDAFKGYPDQNYPITGCYTAGNYVASVNGRTCIGLGYPPYGYAYFYSR